MLLGADAMARLRRCHVIVFGLGGVGSYAAECLARSGVGELTLVDQDTISVTNINRQLYALRSTVGQSKAEVAARRCADIDPELRARDIRRLKVVYSPEEPAETQQLEAPPPGRRSVPASVAWVPATAGLLMGSVVVRDLLHGGGMIP